MKKVLKSFGIFPFFLFVILGVLSFFVPPFQKSDEPVHFYRAMTVASGQWSCRSGISGRKEFVLPKTVYEFPSRLASGDVIMQKDNKFAVGLLKTTYPYTGSNQEMTHEFIYCDLPAIAYVPYAIAAISVSPLNNLLVTFFAMRVVSMLLFFIAFLIAYRLLPKKYQFLLVCFSLLPMVLHQGTAVSYDALSISIFMVVTALFIRMVGLKKKDWSSWVILTALVLLGNAVKPGYYLTIFLPFIVFPLYISLGKKLIIGSIGLFVGILIINANVPILPYLSTLFTAVQKWLVITDPWYFIRVLVESISEDGAYYVKSTIGIFGWLDTELPFFYYICIAGILGAGFYKLASEEDKPVSLQVLILLSLILLASVLLICFHFYIAATPIGYYKIVGMQGRYFLPFLPLLFYCLVQWTLRIRGIRYLPIVIVSIATVCAVSGVIFDRYYNYGSFLANPDALEMDLKRGTIQPKELAQTALDRPMQFRVPVEQGKKMSGFELLLGNQKTTNVLYSYIIKDGACNTAFASGYLDHVIGSSLAHLKQDGELPYTQPLPIIRTTENFVCMVLKPVRADEKPVYLSIYGDQERPVVRFLYIRQ